MSWPERKNKKKPKCSYSFFIIPTSGLIILSYIANEDNYSKLQIGIQSLAESNPANDSFILKLKSVTQNEQANRMECFR